MIIWIFTQIIKRFALVEIFLFPIFYRLLVPITELDLYYPLNMLFFLAIKLFYYWLLLSTLPDLNLLDDAKSRFWLYGRLVRKKAECSFYPTASWVLFSTLWTRSSSAVDGIGIGIGMGATTSCWEEFWKFDLKYVAFSTCDEFFVDFFFFMKSAGRPKASPGKNVCKGILSFLSNYCKLFLLCRNYYDFFKSKIPFLRLPCFVRRSIASSTRSFSTSSVFFSYKFIDFRSESNICCWLFNYCYFEAL